VFVVIIVEAMKSGTMSSSSEIVLVLIGLMVQLCMTKMKGFISAQDIIRRVVTSQSSAAAGTKLGEFKDVMTNMLESNSYELFLNQTINRIIKKDMANLAQEKLSRMVSCSCRRSNWISFYLIFALSD
jgi:cell division protein ZapA (FtsZ GTPase activity inhibitor)